MALGLSAQGAEAQHASDVAGTVGISFLVGEPQGEMGYLVDEGFGAQFDGAFAVAADGHLRLRADFGFMIYGHERQQYCYWAPVGCRVGMDVTTSNAIVFGGLGPEIVLFTGAVEPYVNAAYGVSYFVTSTSLGDDGYDDYATTTNFDDAVMQWRVGGGLRVRVSDGRKPVYLDFAVERHQNGVADYLTEGDIQDHADGSITLYPNRTEANLVTFRMGVSFGIPRGRRHH
jgi:hypothetical protein